MTREIIPIGALFERVERRGRPDLPLLSVYRELGVVPREGREDNNNRLGDDLDAYKVVEPGDLVLNKMKTWQGSLGVSKHHGIVSPAYFVGRPRRAFDPRFVHHLLRSQPLIAEYAARSKGIRPSQWDLPWDEFKIIKTELPPIEEQRAIADYLDAETARIDALIAKKQHLIQLLEERTDALIDRHFSPADAAATVRLARLAYVQTGVTLNAAKALAGETLRLPYLRVANVQPGRLDLSEVKEVEVDVASAARSELRVGDVLMTEGGDIDKLGRGTVWRGEIARCLHQNHVFAVRPDPKVLDSDFLANVTRTSYARAYFESTGVQSTNLASTTASKVSDFRVPMLPVNAQRARCATFERAATPLLHTEAKLRAQALLLAEHRESLVSEATRGCLSPSSCR